MRNSIFIHVCRSLFSSNLILLLLPTRVSRARPELKKSETKKKKQKNNTETEWSVVSGQTTDRFACQNIIHQFSISISLLDLFLFSKTKSIIGMTFHFCTGAQPNHKPSWYHFSLVQVILRLIHFFYRFWLLMLVLLLLLKGCQRTTESVSRCL